MNHETQDFERFLKQRETASQAYVQGNPELLSHMLAHRYPASFFGPTGGSTIGTEKVAAKYTQDANAFAEGSKFSFEIQHMAADNEVAYWVGFMRGEACMRGQSQPIPMELRVTEIFRREQGSWKMVHRHADPLMENKTA